MNGGRRTVRLTVLFKGRESGLRGTLPLPLPPRHQEPFDVYKWKHSKLEYELYLNPDEMQALYIE